MEFVRDHPRCIEYSVHDGNRIIVRFDSLLLDFEVLLEQFGDDVRKEDIKHLTKRVQELGDENTHLKRSIAIHIRKLSIVKHFLSGV
jgi:hypothetical protein